MKKWLLAASMSLTLLGIVACDAALVPGTTTTPAVTTVSTATFTLDELAQYDGLNGHKAYIVVNGIVYDVSSVFVDGKHQGMQLGGTDATLIFASSPHTASLLDELPIVGTLATAQTTTTTTVSTGTTSTTTTTTEATLPVFTASILAQYDGKNGSPAYVAVNGIVYDLSSVFANGMHQGIQMGGTDASVHFESSPHSLSILEGKPVVGTFEASQPVDYLPVFTLGELAQYAGTNGTTAYIAVNGVIYDVTNVFVNGTHRGMPLGGTDATAAFSSSPHSASTLSSLTVVGSLEGAPRIPTGQTNPIDDNLPEAILTYLAANYPNATILEVEREDEGYEIELSNGMELKFDQNGQFLSMEWDD